MITENALNTDHKNGKTSISDLSVEFTIVPIWLCSSDICLIDFHENCKSTFTFFANCIWTPEQPRPSCFPPFPNHVGPKPPWLWSVTWRGCEKEIQNAGFLHIYLSSPFVCECVCVRVWDGSGQLPISTLQIRESPNALFWKLGHSTLQKKNHSTHYYLCDCWSARWIEKAPRIIIIYGAERWFTNRFPSPSSVGFFASGASFGAVGMENFQNLKTSRVNRLHPSLKLKE